jgi:hypothetical protein
MRRIRALAFGLALSGAARAEAAAEVDLQVQVANCPEEIASSLPAGVKLEIDVLRREHGPMRSVPERIAVRCDNAGAEITVAMGGARRTSTVDLGGLAPEHRPRALALAAAEMVHAMIGAPIPEALPATPAPAPSTPVVSPTTAPLVTDSPARPARAHPTLLVGGFAQWLGRPAALLLGARAALRYPLGEIVVPAVSIDGAFGSFPVTGAEVTAATFAAGVHVYAGKTVGHLRLDAGPGTRWGWVHLTGRPDAGSTLEGRSLSAAWGGPEVRARAAYSGGDRRGGIVAIELGAGYVALPVRGLRDGTAPVYAVEGPWISLGVDVGLGF